MIQLLKLQQQKYNPFSKVLRREKRCIKIGDSSSVTVNI